MNIGHPIIATRVKFRVILYNVNLQILKQPWLDQEVNYLIVILHFGTFAIHSISMWDLLSREDWLCQWLYLLK